MATRPVVVGVDGSEESLRAVEWAALEAERRRSPLRIVSAPAMPPRMRSLQASPETVATALRGISARALGAAITRSEEIAPGLLIDTDLLSGTPALAVADSGTGASMLVVGARGAGGFAAMLLGSVSRYAATHAPCPVVVVREGTMAVHREIAVGIRDPQDTTEALAFAFEEAALRDAELVAVHAWYLPVTLLVGVDKNARQQAADPQHVAAEAASSLADAVAGWRDKYPGVHVRQDVVRGHPARVLASYAARTDLVVVGKHGGLGTAGPGIGSIQHAVLNHAGGPVAVVPSGG
jgi:nucleotide-binding universal stress UspA family protein